MIETYLIDLDDTLTECVSTYYIPQVDMVKLILVDLGRFAPDPVQIIQRASDLQTKNIQELGYVSKHCFPQSYLDVYREACEAAGREINPNIYSAIAYAGAHYILREYTPFPGVTEALQALRDAGKRLILVTRGTEEVQNHKIETSKLRPYFDAIEIVNIKNVQTYRDVLEKYNLDPKTTAMVGDSMRNDITPAMQTGIFGFHIYNNHVDFEKSLGALQEVQADNLVVLKSFPEIVNYLDKEPNSN